MHKPQLRRALGFWALAFYCFGDILGAGIYALVGEVAAVAGGAAPFSFALALLVAGLTALSYAELGTRHPQSGPEVRLTTRAFGSESFGLLVGWLVLCSAIVSSAAVSRAFAGYVGELLPSVPNVVLIGGFLLVVALLNFVGIEVSSRTNIAFTLIETAGLLVVLGAGASFLLFNGVPLAAGGDRVATDWSAVAQGGALAFFAFIGFEDVVNVVEEVKRPRRDLPRALLGALLAAGVLYLAVTWVAVRVVDPERLGASEAPLVDVLRYAVPSAPVALFGLVAAFAVANTGLLNSITASRLLYGTARQELLPSWVGRVHGDRHTPHLAILLVLGLSALLAYSGSLAFLAGTTSVLLLAVFGSVHAALLRTKLRARAGKRAGVLARSAGERDERSRHFEVPSMVPVFGLVSCFALLTWVPPESAVRALVLIAVGAVLSGVWRWRHRSASGLES